MIMTKALLRTLGRPNCVDGTGLFLRPPREADRSTVLYSI